MHWIDYIIFGLYFIIVLGIGFYFYKKNKDRDDYYVGGRSISSTYIGLSVVATDVGGGFSIGLGGLGFIMGLSGSWLLFTGLVGAWLAAVLTVPILKRLDMKHGLLTYPDFLKIRIGKKTALAAALISGIGYMGFTGAQILAGAKLAAGSVFSEMTFMDPLHFSLYIMAAIILLYTVLGGLKAVIYTDAVQWIILLGGLFLFGVPFTFFRIGGWEAISNALPDRFFNLGNVSIFQIINWFLTIIPIWFIAMTLYQRVYASRDVKTAKKAFFIAGILEYPFMAFAGVALGMMAKVQFPSADAEMAMPMLLGQVLPLGIAGIVIAAYLSAIMSTADSCLIASSGNFVNDIIEKYWIKKRSDKFIMRLSQLVTLMIGAAALIIASISETVLDAILHTYSFMVSGLLVPTLAAYFKKNVSETAALASMLSGCAVTFIFLLFQISLPFGLDPGVAGLAASGFVFLICSILTKKDNY